MSTTKIKRSGIMMAKPVRLERAYDDPRLILSLVNRGAPYKTITAVQKNPPNDDTPGWFRNFWALGGKVVFEGAEAVFHNRNFIEAAKLNFNAEIIEPLAMMTNLNVPAPSSPPHLDLPFFRGAHQREVPGWILEPMGESRLFQDWAIPVASAISWFHEGEGGEFEYWSEGFDQPSHSISQPCFNHAAIADNEYMYHRVCRMGKAEDYLMDGISSEALLHRNGSNWDIKVGEELIRSYRDEQIRISVLWKAFCFRDQREADAFHDHSHDLTRDLVVDIFCEELKRRGVTYREPTDLDTDTEWINLIKQNFKAPEGFAY